MNFEDVVWMTIFLGIFVGFIKLIRYSNNYWTDFVKCKHAEPGHDKVACEQFKQVMSFLWLGGLGRW
jgi:hypothetical protein